MMMPWECSRCHVMNAPDAKQCTCPWAPREYQYSFGSSPRIVCISSDSFREWRGDAPPTVSDDVNWRPVTPPPDDDVFPFEAIIAAMRDGDGNFEMHGKEVWIRGTKNGGYIVTTDDDYDDEYVYAGSEEAMAALRKMWADK